MSDNGPGIPAEHIPHLFDRFYQIDPARTRHEQEAARSDSGSGLGLAIVNSIAEAYGGGVEVKPEPGQGADAIRPYGMPARGGHRVRANTAGKGSRRPTEHRWVRPYRLPRTGGDIVGAHGMRP